MKKRESLVAKTLVFLKIFKFGNFTLSIFHILIYYAKKYDRATEHIE